MAGPVSRVRVGNLPADTTSFLGRKADTTEVRQLLSVSRLVTLTGVGGVGKTRLALRVAATVARGYPDGVWLVELDHVRDGALVAHSVNGVLGVRDETGRDPVQVLIEYLRDRKLLLILDNCEHLLAGCRKLVDAVLAGAARVKILATGRERLRLPDECVWQVAPLPLPDPERPPAVGAAVRYPALMLFAERASAAAPGFALTAENEARVARVCQLLDGLPLAIELVAVRLRALSLEQVESRLADRYWSLASGRRGQVPRQQTLHATVAWSYNLCGPRERLLWERSAVFAGSFDLAAAEAVCAGEGLPADRLGALLTGLVDRSVLMREADGLTTRYRLLETLRQFGRDRLRETGEEIGLRRRHRDHYLALVEDDEVNWFGARQPEIGGRARLELANLRTALAFCLDTAGEQAAGLRMAAKLWYQWVGGGMLGEGRHWLDRALSLDRRPGPDRAHALWVAGYVATQQGDLAAAVGMLEECLGYAREAGDEVALAYATHRLGGNLLVTDDVEGAVALLEEARQRYARLAMMDCHVMLTGVSLAMAALLVGDLDRAARLSNETREIGEAHGEQWALANVLFMLALIALRRGELRQARTYGRQSLRIKRTFNDLLGVVLAVELLAWGAAAAGGAERAAVLLGAATQIWPSVGYPMFGSRHFGAPHRDCELLARRDLGDRQFEAAYRRGMALSVDDAVAYALGEDDAPASGTSEADQPRTTVLTPREQEVAELVGEGLSNREIAKRLVISSRTVESHVQRVLQKFGFTSRAQVAGWAAQQRGK